MHGRFPLLFRNFSWIVHHRYNLRSPTDGPNSQALEDRRTNKRLFKLLLWLAILFSICALPFSLFFIHLIAIDKATVFNNRDRFFFVHRMVRFLLSANSFFNPLVYAFQSSNYRNEFKRIFCCKSLSGTDE